MKVTKGEEPVNCELFYQVSFNVNSMKTIANSFF